MYSPAEQSVLDEAPLSLTVLDNPLSVYEHLLIEDVARSLFCDLVGLRECTTADNFAIACEAYRKSLDFLVVARMFDRLHPESAAGCRRAHVKGEEIEPPNAP